jgi:hypothetical protein
MVLFTGAALQDAPAQLICISPPKQTSPGGKFIFAPLKPFKTDIRLPLQNAENGRWLPFEKVFTLFGWFSGGVGFAPPLPRSKSGLGQNPKMSDMGCQN